MTKHLITLLTLMLAGASAVPALAQKTPESVHGAPVVVTANDGRVVHGELIAATPDSIWVLNDSGLVALSVVGLRSVDVRRANSTKFFAHAALGGAAQAGLLTAACLSVEGGGCGAVFAVSALIWAGVAALAIPGVSGASRLRVNPVRWNVLRPYSRFPHDPPEDLRLLLRMPSETLPAQRHPATEPVGASGQTDDSGGDLRHVQDGLYERHLSR
jgi:hypothetical protein